MRDPAERTRALSVVAPALGMMWTVATFLLTAAYASNLKASFISETYEPKVNFLIELIERYEKDDNAATLKV